MLVLGRKPGERILIGDNIVVTVVRFNGGTVRLGIEAPQEFPVIREELRVNTDCFAAKQLLPETGIPHHAAEHPK